MKDENLLDFLVNTTEEVKTDQIQDDNEFIMELEEDNILDEELK